MLDPDMNNVIKFHGAMRPDAMERMQQRNTEEAREMHDSAMRSLTPLRRPSVLPNVIDLDHPLLARLERALRAFGRVLRGITTWSR